MHKGLLVAIFAPLVVLMLGATSSTDVPFTASQISAGAKQYSQSCAQCHGAHLEGGVGPALTGPNFETLSKKVGASVGDIFTFMATEMPFNAPGSLSHDQYVKIMAYILSKNGYRPGKTPLSYSQAQNSKARIIRQ